MAARRPPGRTGPPADGSPPGPPAGRPDGLEAAAPTPTTTSPAPPPPSLYNHPLYRVIKEEPADPLPVGGAFPEPAPPGPAPPDLGKRRSKPPIKLLDPGFLFSFCRPAGGGGPPGGLKREEDSVDICLTRSVSREQFAAAAGPQPRVLRPRGAPAAAPPLLRVKRERVEKSPMPALMHCGASGTQRRRLQTAVVPSVSRTAPPVYGPDRPRGRRSVGGGRRSQRDPLVIQGDHWGYSTPLGRQSTTPVGPTGLSRKLCWGVLPSGSSLTAVIQRTLFCGVLWSVVFCGGLWSVVVSGVLWCSLVVCGGL
ncbi:unnamed protein product [Boreogadus saida]